MFASVAKFSETLEARRIDPEYFDPQDVGDLEAERCTQALSA